MKLSLYTLLGMDLSLEEMIEKAAQYGFDAIDIRMSDEGVHISPDISDQDIRSLRKCVEEVGLMVSGVTSYYKLGLTDPEETDEMVEKIGGALHIAEEFETGFLRVTAADLDVETGYEQQRESFRRQIGEVSTMAAESGVAVTIEQHSGGLFASAGQICDIMRGTDSTNVGIVFDPANCVREGYQRPWVQVEMLAPFIMNVHVKNMALSATNEPAETMPSEAARLDKGLLDWPKIIASLIDKGYDGYLTLEDFYDFGSLDEKLSWDAEYLLGILNG